MNELTWQGYQWLTSERWGQIHPDQPNVWYDPSAVDIDADGNLNLFVRPNPKVFKLDKKEIKSTVGIGLVSCKTEFGPGLFEIEAKLPSGPYAWPAFWMWSFQTWPPEIDVFEGYSNNRGSYFNLNLGLLLGRFWKVESNLHLGIQPNNYSIGAKKHRLGFKSPDRVFNKYSLEWTPTRITFLFNDKKVRTVEDPSVLKQLLGKTMNVVINNSIQDSYIKTSMPQTVMTVKNFKWTKL